MRYMSFVETVDVTTGAANAPHAFQEAGYFVGGFAPKETPKNVAVIGLGYVGLPLAVQAAHKGYNINGIDLDQNLVSLINKRISPFANDTRFEAAFNKTGQDKLAAGSNFNVLKEADVVVICVPTPTINNVPDLKYVIASATSIAQNLQKGQLIILESTVNPGITRDAILPILETTSGMKVGQDFYLAHCPERIDPGNKKFHVGNLNRVVGGITPDCTKRAQSFYQDIIDASIIPLGSTEEAEFVKSWENTHRNVMIALANQAAIISDGLGMDIQNILRGLQSKVDQFGLKLAQPGIGPGGHCIPEDIHYVIRKARESGIDTRFLDNAADLNDNMQNYAVQRFQQMVLDHGERLNDLNVGLLGLAYKEDIEDARRSPAIEVANSLILKTRSLCVHDPFVDKSLASKHKYMTRIDDLHEVLERSDALFIGTAHTQYIEALTPELLLKYDIKYVFDGRNCLDKNSLVKAGITYKAIGR